MGRRIPQNNGDISYQIADMLLAIEAEMRQLGLWERAMPAQADLESVVPFCGDRLSLEQWLQWIFVPRMKDLVTAGKGLPSHCDIAPYAREVWCEELVLRERLILLLKDFDELIYRVNETLRH